MASPADECRAFLAAQGSDLPAADALAAALTAAIDRAEVADRIGFAAYLGARIPSDVDPVAALAARKLDDLGLAFACVAGDPAACRRFDAAHLGKLAGLLEHQGIAADAAAEAVQRLRERLLTGERPGLAAYAGSGGLDGWLRISALREAIRIQRGVRAHEPEAVADALADAAGDPALQYQRRLYEAEFRVALTEAAATLDVRERNLLKQSVLYGATIDDLGALYRVHRSTVARWLAAARERLAEATRQRLIAQLRIEPADYDSILQLIHSQLDISITRLFA